MLQPWLFCLDRKSAQTGKDPDPIFMGQGPEILN